MAERRIGLAQGLLPLLDVTILLLGFFMILLADRAGTADAAAGVFAGKAFVLLEVAQSEARGEYRVYATDEAGRKTGPGTSLERCDRLVEERLGRMRDTVAEPEVVVVVGFGKVFDATTWTPAHAVKLRRALSERRTLMLWSD